MVAKGNSLNMGNSFANGPGTPFVFRTPEFQMLREMQVSIWSFLG